MFLVARYYLLLNIIMQKKTILALVLAISLIVQSRTPFELRFTRENAPYIEQIPELKRGGPTLINLPISFPPTIETTGSGITNVSDWYGKGSADF